jgi:catalase
LREKLTHFDHERIPERVVHARGSAAHGYFECSESLADITRAELFAEAGKRTPVFVRFSTVAGERGSADTVRDTRGFATKFYTDDGNWDLVGNNIPVFFIQDAMKFPDLVHAVKPELHHAMPQASSAHDTFWDFISLMPESIHHTLWVMSDRGIPRSYRTMQGFGVHTFRFVNARNESVFVKFHWLPAAGTHSLVWDEAAKIAGADPDFHRRDLWESIESGLFPEYELAIQVFTEEEADKFSFDVLDATKIVPEELVPLRVVGRMVLNRNPDNFFAETEQVAFCTAHVVPGIDFTNDPLLQGRIHSYIDTQISRLGGANFHEIPVNASLTEVHNNQRDGMHRKSIHRGRVAYEPNSLAGGCPFQAGPAGFVSFPQPARPGEMGAAGRRVAVLLADGVDLKALLSVKQAFDDAGIVPRWVGARLGKVTSTDGQQVEVETTLEAMPSVLWDATVVLAMHPMVSSSGGSGPFAEFLRDQYRHCKPILLMGWTAAQMADLGIMTTLPNGEEDPGLFLASGANALPMPEFIEALARHRHFERESDPPKV